MDCSQALDSVITSIYHLWDGFFKSKKRSITYCTYKKIEPKRVNLYQCLK